jgi:hypothetical protein
VRRLVERRAIRAVVLLLALGVGGVAGAPTMALPPRAGVSISDGDDDEDHDDPGGGGDPGATPPGGHPDRRVAALAAADDPDGVLVFAG